MSYCVYSAATIELQQLDDLESGGTAAANERLATILKMLGTEAKQTPGIQRSIEIIKTRLELRERPSSQHIMQPRLGHPMAAHPSHRSVGPDAYCAMDLPLMEPSTMHSHFEVPHVHGEAVSQHAGPHHNVHRQIEGVGSQLPHPDGVPWMDWSGYNVSGGFASDVANWTYYDTVPDIKLT